VNTPALQTLREDRRSGQNARVVHIKDLYPAVRDPALAGRTAADLLPVARPLITRRKPRASKNCSNCFSNENCTSPSSWTNTRHHRHRHARKCARSARRPDSRRVRSGKIGIDARERRMSGRLPGRCRCMNWKNIGETHLEESVATASGWMTQKLGGFPKAGDALTIGACELRVEEMDGPRVARLKITRHAVRTARKFRRVFRGTSYTTTWERWRLAGGFCQRSISFLLAAGTAALPGRPRCPGAFTTARREWRTWLPERRRVDEAIFICFPLAEV